MDALRILLDGGADVTKDTLSGLTPLIMAQRRELPEAVEMIEEALARRP